jgi:hypothetical protein
MVTQTDRGYYIYVKFSRIDAWFIPFVYDDESIAEVKQDLWHQALIHPASQELVFEGCVLKDYRTVQNCGITAEACIVMNQRKSYIGDFVGQNLAAEVEARLVDLRFARLCMRPQATGDLLKCNWKSPMARTQESPAMVIPGQSVAPSIEPLPTLWSDRRKGC